MIFRQNLIPFTILWALVSVGCTVAADIFISPNGNDSSGNGLAGNPFATINRAVAQAVNGDVINLLTGNYTFSEPQVVNKTLTIVGGTSPPSSWTLSLTDATLGPVISFLGSINVTLRDVRLFANLSGTQQTYNAVLIDGAMNVTFSNVNVLILSDYEAVIINPVNPCIRITNTAYFSFRDSLINGATMASSVDTIDIIRTTITKGYNTGKPVFRSEFSGSSSALVRITDSSFTGHSEFEGVLPSVHRSNFTNPAEIASYNGGCILIQSCYAAEIRIQDSKFEKCFATLPGGSIAVLDSPGPFVAVNVVFQEGLAYRAGGALFATNVLMGVFLNNTFFSTTYAVATGDTSFISTGAVIAVSGSSLTMNGGSIRGARWERAFGIFSYFGGAVTFSNDATFNNVVFDSNNGGAVLATNGFGADLESPSQISFTNCVFLNNAGDNYAVFGALGIFRKNSFTRIHNCTFDGNSFLTQLGGAALWVSGVNATVNATRSNFINHRGNQNTDVGATILLNDRTVDVAIHDCGIASNTVGSGSGGIFVRGGTLRLHGSTSFQSNAIQGSVGFPHLFVNSTLGEPRLISETGVTFSPVPGLRQEIGLDGAGIPSRWDIFPTATNTMLTVNLTARVLFGGVIVNCSRLFCAFGDGAAYGAAASITFSFGELGGEFLSLYGFSTIFTLKSDLLPYGSTLSPIRLIGGVTLIGESRLQLDAVDLVASSALATFDVEGPGYLTLNFRSRMTLFTTLQFVPPAGDFIITTSTAATSPPFIEVHGNVIVRDVTVVLDGTFINVTGGVDGQSSVFDWIVTSPKQFTRPAFALPLSYERDLQPLLAFSPKMRLRVYKSDPGHLPILRESVRFIGSDVNNIDLAASSLPDRVLLNVSAITSREPTSAKFAVFNSTFPSISDSIYLETIGDANDTCGERPGGSLFYCRLDPAPPTWVASNDVYFRPATYQHNLTRPIVSTSSGFVMHPSARVYFSPGSFFNMSVDESALSTDICPTILSNASAPAQITVQVPNVTFVGTWVSFFSRRLFEIPTQCESNIRTAVSNGALVLAADIISGQDVGALMGCPVFLTQLTQNFDGFTYSCPPPGGPPVAVPMSPPLAAAPRTNSPSGGDAIVPSSSPVGAIVGAIIAVLALVAIVAIVIFFLRKRRGKQATRKPAAADPSDEKQQSEMAPVVHERTPEVATPRAAEEPVAIVTPPVIAAEPAIVVPAVDGAIPLADVTFMQELGKGSWGTVSLAVYKGEFVAVKRLSSGASGSQLSTLMGEAKMMSSIKAHRNLVKFIGICSDSASFGLMMEFCPRGSLLSFLRSNKGEAISDYELFKFTYGILEGMIALTTVGLVHRDLAARNVLLDERMFSKVSDFGSSRRSNQIEEEKGKQDDTLGPIKWQPPEVLNNQAYSEKSDVWSFGCTLLEIVTRREPYAGYSGNILQLIQDIKDGRINPLMHAEKLGGYDMNSWPVWVLPTLRSCFEEDPSKRPSFREIRFRINPKARKNLDDYEAEIDEIDSVLSTQHYSSVPATHSKSSWNAASAASATGISTANASTEILAVVGDVADLGSVERLGKLGEGSFGTVFLGKYKGQYVAIKVLNLNSADGQAVLREAEVMSLIAQHRNIVQLFGIVKENDHIDIVMEFAPKGSCEDYVASAKGKKIGEALLFKWALGIARGMAHLTASKVIHRDLSARNVLLDSSLEPKIADFGLGRTVLDPNQESSTQTDVGPLRWFAPECFELKYSEKTDVWAYGCTLIELATGELPFPSKSVMDVFMAVKDQATPMDEVPPNLPAWLMKTMQKCFARNAKDRATFEELVAFIETQADTIDEIREAEAAIQRRRNKRAGTVLV
eukprot:TRINITY_DN3748_c0_g2_i4.p1 TRINITY_DN3748_c0_g2~~TRINITY_DN3748_c0_g2_i4.p1  ORF type:complete len:1840 (-),score=297.70 TRINITY_DN3748_c0_g2_i4:39-5558(-)